MDQPTPSNKIDKMKVRLLAPVREVSWAIPVHVIPRGSKKSKVADGNVPNLVQALPPKVKHSMLTVKPEGQRKKDVDLVIADYLCHAKYSWTVPILYPENPATDWRGGSLICACCADRNRESLLKKFPMQHGNDPNTSRKAKDLPEHHRNEPDSQDHNTQTFIKSGFSHLECANIFQPKISSQYKTVNQISAHHDLHSWGYYQPIPNVGTFLNFEFNRPFVRQTSRITSRNIAQCRYISRKIIEASEKYDYNMRKLQEHIENGFILPEGVIYMGRN